MLVRLRSSAVVGIGSSGLQTIGTIAPFAKSVSVFARSKFWVSTDWNYKCRLRKCRLTWESDLPSGFSQISPPYLAERAGVRDWKGGNFYCTLSIRPFPSLDHATHM
jgi:hypothetical protein